MQESQENYDKLTDDTSSYGKISGEPMSMALGTCSEGNRNCLSPNERRVNIQVINENVLQ